MLRFCSCRCVPSRAIGNQVSSSPADAMVILIPKLDPVRSMNSSALVLLILPLLEITTYYSERVSTVIITRDTLISILGFVSYVVGTCQAPDKLIQPGDTFTFPNSTGTMEE